MAPHPLQRRVALALALGITGVCVAMSAAAAADRGAGFVDQALYTATAAAFVIGSHVLPALSSRRPWMWLLSALCLLATLYHLGHFFGAAGERAGQHRAAAPAASAADAAIAAELAQLQARPLTEVAAELAKAQGAAARADAALARCEAKCTSAQAAAAEAKAKVQGLAVARQQAEHAAELMAQRRQLSSAADAATTGRKADPLDAQIASATGLPVGTVGLLASLVQGLLLEVLGMVAWAVAIPSAADAKPAQAQQVAARAPRVPQLEEVSVIGDAPRRTGPRAVWPAKSAKPAPQLQLKGRAVQTPADLSLSAWLTRRMFTGGMPWQRSAAPH